MSIIKDELVALADKRYRDFHSRLVPSVDKNKILGVRGPECKKIAKKHAGSELGERFMDTLPHEFYDEGIVHGYMLGYLRLPVSELEKRISALLPYMDNWAIVDSCVANLKSFFKSPDTVLDFVKDTLKSSHEYTVRFGIVSLLCYYLTPRHADEAMKLVSKIRSDKFYIKMAQAWFFATALTKHYESALPYIQEKVLDPWTHNKAIQKARESYRVPSDIKCYLNTLKIK
ncbi:MAG: DNA alkylation repair protein [Clostridia bacterium]|nr:DNA alkylation repair protein [Clostridia bacterium]